MKITFMPSSSDVELYVDKPLSAKKFVPEWYKKTQTFDSKNVIFDERVNEIKNLGIKKCMPFFDSLVSGYIQSTWCDIYINVSDNKIDVRSASGPDILSFREHESVTIPDFFYNIEFVWKVNWIPKVPRGYSVLMTHPLNRYDLPFQTMSGIIDSDSFYHSPTGNMPFYIKKNFSGFIPKGTPMYQIIPIKRSSWNSEYLKYSKKIQKFHIESYKHFMGFYKNNFWNKKNFN